MSGVNKVILVGRVGNEPEIRSMNSGDRIANLSLATSETWRDKSSGERKEKTEWHRVVVFNDGLVKVIEQYVKKGDLIYIEGQLQTRKWEKDGVERYSTEVVLKAFNGVLTMLSSKRDGEGGGDQRSGGGYSNSRSDDGYSRGGDSYSTGGRKENYDLNDDIPF